MKPGDKISNCELIGTTDPRWIAALSRMPHDIYHQPGYVDVASRNDGGTAAALYVSSAQGELLVPIVLRELPEILGETTPYQDAASPYGYASPLIDAPDTNTAIDLINRATDLAAEHSIVSLFLRAHPLLATAQGVFERFGVVKFEGPTVTIETSAGDLETWRQMRKGHRYDIRRAHEHGFETVIDDWSMVSEFVRLYHETMERVNASHYYQFDDVYFSELIERLAGQAHLFIAVAPTGDVAAGGLFTQCDGIVEYHLSGTSINHREFAPTKMLINEARQWAIHNGAKVLHLGGGVGGRTDSLFDFKAGFSQSWAAYRTIRIEVLPDVYADLAERTTRSAGEIDQHFFPRYRALASGLEEHSGEKSWREA